MLAPRELACRITDREGEFLSASSVYRILKAADLIESPAYILLKAAGRFQHSTRRRQGKPSGRSERAEKLLERGGW